jgi:hypothetical protein
MSSVFLFGRIKAIRSTSFPFLFYACQKEEKDMKWKKHVCTLERLSSFFAHKFQKKGKKTTLPKPDSSFTTPKDR